MLERFGGKYIYILINKKTLAELAVIPHHIK